jgi:hypothetical protein
MKCFLCCCSTLALLTSAIRSADADDASWEIRPVVVASFAPYAELKSDLDYLGLLSGNAELAAGLERWLLPFATGRELAGLDKQRPWGATLATGDGDSRLSLLVFLPVDDFNNLLDALAAPGKANDVGDGIYEVKQDTHEFFIAQQGSWACAARQKSDLEDRPADPAKQFAGLSEPYDVALRIYPHSVPPGMRGLAALFIKQALTTTTRLRLNAGDEQHALIALAVNGMADGALQTLEGLERLTLGLSIDRSSGRTSLDIEIATSPESDAAEQPAAETAKPQGSRLAGLLMPDAIFSLHLDSPLSAAAKQQADEWLKCFRDRLSEEIDNETEEGLDGKQKATAKELTSKFVDLLGETLTKEGRMHAGLAVIGPRQDAFEDMIGDAIEQHFPNRIHETIIGAGQVTVVAGGAIADGARWEDTAMKTVAAVAEGAGLDPPKLNVDNYKGWRFHTISVMAPQTMRAELPLRALRNLLGNPLKIVFAFGNDTFFAAVGEKGSETIKRVIDGSAQTPAAELPPVIASVGLARLCQLIASENRSSMAAKIAAGLLRGGNDHAKLTLQTFSGGVRCRMEGEAAVNKLLCFCLGRAAGLSVAFNPAGAAPPKASRPATQTPDGGTTTTTTTGPDGTTTTVTQTESNGQGGQSSRREVTVTRRSSSRGRPAGARGANGRTPASKTASDDKKPAQPQTELRTWSSKNGKFKVEARFVELQDDSVKLITDDGERLTVAIDKLSDGDQKVARQLAEELEENPFAPKTDDN